MSDLLAIISIMFWIVIPLFWIPVHLFSISFRRLGIKAYLLPAFTWLPLLFFIYKYMPLFLHYRIEFPFVLSLTGWVLFVGGIFLHLWTARLLGLWGIIGGPEVSGSVRGNLVTSGPFSIVRHPTYFAHTILFSGVFLITGVLAVGIVTAVDFLIVNVLIIPLEEKELTNRFGERFTSYKKKVSYRFFPRVF